MLVSVHPRVYERLTSTYPELKESLVPELQVTRRAAWHAGGTPIEWLNQFTSGKVEWLHTDFIGMDHIPDVGETVVTNGRGTTEDVVAEWILAAVLMACKRLGSYHTWTDKYGQKPILLREARIVIIGRGAIGKESRRLMFMSGARHIVLTGAMDLDAIDSADVVVVTTSLRPDTVGLIDRHVLDRMRKGAWLISISHGKVIRDEDLAQSLLNNHLGGAILDCFENEPLPPENALWSCAVVSPHLAWYSPESTDRRVKLFLRKLREWETSGGTTFSP